MNNPEKLISKTLELLREVPTFQQFWNKHSILAQLFPSTDSLIELESIAELQTRVSVQAALQQQVGTPANNNNANPSGYIQGQLQEAEAELTRLKDKFNHGGALAGLI